MCDKKKIIWGKIEGLYISFRTSSRFGAVYFDANLYAGIRAIPANKNSKLDETCM